METAKLNREIVEEKGKDPILFSRTLKKASDNPLLSGTL